ncbi:MAG: TrkA C-terminal domain-containing protein [Candidatus Izemoplasmatales bacterium]
MYGGGSNIIEILDNVGANTIAQVKVINVPEPLKDKTLEISNIRKDYMINVLAIITGRETNANVTKDDIIKKDDKVIVYGKVVNIKKLFLKTQE